MKYWGEGLAKVEHEMKHKHDDFRQSLNPNTMEAGIWLVEELQIIDLDLVPPPDLRLGLILLSLPMRVLPLD